MRKECLNFKNKYFTGEENTPLGKGYSASGEKIGTRKKGKNGYMYEVVKYQGGKRWQRVNNFHQKRQDSPRGNSPLVAGKINEILGDLVKSYRSYTYLTTTHEIRYEDKQGNEIYMAVNTDNSSIEISAVEFSPIFTGLGLCKPLVMFLLLKAYNNLTIEPEQQTITGTVTILSKVHDRAFKCYLDSFRNIGFLLYKSGPVIGHPLGKGYKNQKLIFMKRRPMDGWNKLYGIYTLRGGGPYNTVIDYKVSHQMVYAF